jgi:TPR repeat protein
MGMACFKGEAMVKDLVEACVWYGRAAEQGNFRAQFLLGIAYEFGQGVGNDRDKAAFGIAKLLHRTTRVLRKP